MACIKPINDIVTPPNAPSAREAISRSAQAPATRAPLSPPAAPSLRVESSAANQSITSAQRAVRLATSIAEIRQAVTKAANALYDARHAGASHKELGKLTSNYRSVQSQARSKAQSLGLVGESLFNDGSVYETRIREDGKTDLSFNDSGSMRDPHGHVVESPDSTPEQTIYDYVRDADGNVYIDRKSAGQK